MSSPRWALWLLERLAPPDQRDEVAGDLEEAHRARTARGALRANVATAFETIDMAFALLRVRASRRIEFHEQLERVLDKPVHGTRRKDMREMLENWGRDFVHAVRNIGRAPAFAAVTVITLGLAIGANTAIFSVVDAVLLDPLGFDEPDELVAIYGAAPGTDLPEEFALGTEFYVQYRENATALEDLGLYQGGSTTVQNAEHAERLYVSGVSPSLFSTLRVQPLIGRLPTDADPEGTVGVISHSLWTDWYGRDPGVLGQTIRVSGQDVTILGVMGPEFRFPDRRVVFWGHDLPTEPIQPGNFGNINLVGRLAPGADIESLRSQLANLAQRLPERFGGSPAYARIIAAHVPVVRSLEEDMIGNVRRPIWVLAGTVGFVLLIASANVANLLMVRAESRRRDFAVRRALGAGRWSLVRSQMAESTVLALLGGVLGALLARAGVPALVAAAPEGIPRLEDVALNGNALLFAAGVSLLAACAAGLLPAIRFSNPRLMSLREGGRTVSRADHRTRDALVVVQTAAALVLLVGSALLVQSFRSLMSVDTGYETENIFTFQMAPDPELRGLEDGVSLARYHYDFMDRLDQLAGVESVGLVATLPLDEGAGFVRFVTDRTGPEEDQQPLMRVTFASANYFPTMGIELLRGRDFERRDQPAAEVGAIVSQSAAELLWPGEDAIGKRLRPAPVANAWTTVIGVVEDVILQDFRQGEPEPLVYLPLVGAEADSWGVGTPAYVVKSPRAEAIAQDIRTLVREIAPEAPVYRTFTMEQLADRSVAALSFTMLTLGVAAALGLILGAVGLYGVLSYVVTQRTREIGIRMALGAEAARLRRMVVAQGGRVVLLGVAIGAAASIWLTRMLEGLLFGVSATDVPTFVAMALVMLGVAVVASYVPARRASAVDPMLSLRVE